GSLPAAPVSPGGSKAPGDLTLSGTVEQGVEPGCLILRTDTGKGYELSPGNHVQLKVGDQVVVTGKVATGMMSHCQQGPIFQVSSVRPG
ncbi:MAG TPA: DUF5818 domain-containing protein, partial [Rugosimonospora sp.]|nr:DUF5818 domain-containing protein [Rugosimonospora sp.]